MEIRHEASYRGKVFRFCRDFRHAAGVAAVPLIASEIYNVCNEVPLLFAKSGDRWTVLGILRDPALRESRLGDDGGWSGDYSPFMLRIHPFRLATDGGWEVAPDGVFTPPVKGRPFLDENGGPSPPFAEAKAMLREASAGLDVLSARVAALETAGLLVPFATGFVVKSLSETLAPLFCVDALRLARTSPALLARLTDGVPSAADVAFASLHAMRLFEGTWPDRAVADLESRIATLIDRSARAAGPQPMKQDEAPEEPLVEAGRAPLYELDRSETIDFSRLF